MNAAKTRRLVRDYLAAVEKVFLALENAKNLQAAMRRELTKRRKEKECSRPAAGGASRAS
jgi:hypothetical protein